MKELEKKKYENNNMIVFDSAYRRALTTILDANITTFIAAIILYSIGSGPIKGFLNYISNRNFNLFLYNICIWTFFSGSIFEKE